MALPPRVCPVCAEEYVHSALRCVHCDVALVHAEEAPAQAAQDLPPAAELTPIRIASAGWALALSELLVAEGIAHRVELVSDAAAEGRRPSGPGPYGVYVRAGDAARARAIDAGYVAREIPDLPDGWEDAEAEDEGCPACGAAVAAGAAECPDCGLALA
jgi:hypothetical protein